MNNRKALVLGMARSGIAVSKLLVLKGAQVLICDRKTEAEFAGALDELKIPGISWHLGEDPQNLLSQVDLMVISPGVPVDHPAVIKAKEMGVEVIGELECAYRESNGLLLAVTGTNGKTTTCTLLGEIFKNAGRRVSVVGNIGAPYSAAVPDMKAGDVTVCEVSSFQMETTRDFHPAISAVLNISEDHLNRHGTMENYIALKERIFENSGENDFVVLNWDDEVTRDMARRAKCGVLWFSTKQAVENGAYAADGNVVFVSNGTAKVVCAADEIYIPGEHNLKNALAATAMAMASGVPAPVVRHTLKTFKGVEHRIEFVREISGVRFINDSKGTNADSTIQAIRAMKRPTVIILGGYDKHSDFLPMCREMAGSMVKKCVLIGDTAKQFEDTLKAAGISDYVMAGYDFDAAINTAFEMAGDGWNVLLSPACASFDMFADYEARGRIFKEKVCALEEKKI